MTSSDLWTAETAAEYDERNADRFDPAVLGPTLDTLERLAGGGPVLELAIGTGRVGVALHERGLKVEGIELSAPMAAKVHEKVPAGDLPVVVGDMATATAPGAGGFGLVALVFNTLSNLRTQDEQVECFRNAARHLRPGGRFVIELWVPPLHRMSGRTPVVPMGYAADGIAFDTYDPATQECTSQSYRTQDDGTVRHRVGRFRYLWPSECDLMARLAGMELEHRWSDWQGRPFMAGSENHVSVYRLPQVPGETPLPDPWPREVDGLVLRRARHEDVATVLSFRNDPGVNRWMLRTHVAPDELRRGLLHPEARDRSVVVERDGEVVALGFLEVQDAAGQPGRPAGTDGLLGYIVRPGFDGQGIASTTARALVRAAFEDLGLRRVVAYAHADNPASVRVLEKAGLRRELHARGSLWHAEHGWVDEVGYALLRDEWVAP